jgi:hypothetical protein
MRHFKAALFALLALLPSAALAQSLPPWPITTYGYVASPAQWGVLATMKQDYLGAPPVLTSGGIMTGELTTAPATASRSGFNCPPGVAPTSPVNGDIWCTNAGVFSQVNGSTIGPLIGGGSSTFTGTSPIVPTFPGGGVVNYAFNFSVSNTFLANQTGQGATTTQPGWYAQISGDTFARARIGPNSADVAAVSFGPGNAARDTHIERAAPATLRLGSTDAAAPIAQTLIVQNVIAGTSNTAGTNLTINGSQGTGTGGGGSIIFQVAPSGSTGTAQNALSPALTLNSSKLATFGGHVSIEGVTSAGATGTGNLVFGSLPTISTPTIAGGALSGTFSGTPTFSGANFLTLSNLAQSSAGAQFLGVSGASTANYAPFTLASLANLASPSPTLDLIPITDHTTGTIKNVTPAAIAGSVVSGVATLNSQTGNLVGWTPPQGRLSLSTAAVMTASVAGATAINYVAYTGHNVPIYNGTAVVQAQICAANTIGNCLLSVTLGSNWLASTFYDWLIAWNSGTPTLCSVAWTNSTTRATALTPIDGLNTNASSFTCATGNSTSITVPANQGTYVGTCETGLAGQFNHIYGGTAAGGTAAFIGCWNAFNRIQQRTIVSDTTASWTYAVALTWRAANAGLPAHVQGTFVRGLAEDSLVGTYYGFSQPGAGSASAVGVGLDSTTTPCGITMPATQAAVNQAVTANCASIPGIGAHVMAALEWNFNTTAGTFYGLPNAGGQTGLEMVFSY